MSDRFWRCLRCGFPEEGERPDDGCPKCESPRDTLYEFDNETNFMFRRMKWDRQHRLVVPPVSGLPKEIKA